MNEIPAQENERFLMARILDALLTELYEEKNPDLGVRKALLGLMFVAAQKYPKYDEFSEFILTEFQPVADQFDNDRHPFVGDHDIMRWQNGEKYELLLHTDFVESVMSRDPTMDDIFWADMKWPWERTAMRFVAFFDIMGFKALVERHAAAHDEIYDILHHLRMIAGDSQGIGYSTNEPESPLNYSGCWIRFFQFSDSIILITRDDSEKSSAMITLAAHIVFMKIMYLGVGVRGAVARGVFTADFENSIFVGQPLVDAYLLEGKQNWYGIAFHPTYHDRTQDGEDKEYPKPPDGYLPSTIEYSIPVKGANSSEEYSVLNWPMFMSGGMEKVDELIEHLRYEQDDKLMSYYLATRAFAQDVLKRMGKSNAD